MKHKNVKIAIVGGGVAGSSAALYLGRLGVDVTLFEKEQSLVTGPPFCHLHAGGNLYREISDAQCVALLKQSIAFLRFFPYIIDYRPTLIALPTTDKSTPKALLPRLEMLKVAYQTLINEDPLNEVLQKPEAYYTSYTKADLQALKSQTAVQNPQSFDEWMIPVAQHLDLEKVQFPLIMVQEYGLNLFRLAAGNTLELESLSNVTLQMQTQVEKIQKHQNQWKLFAKQNNKTTEQTFDYLINAAGFRAGSIDDMVGAPCQSMVEFKAAYVTQWAEQKELPFPEIIFHGERGTPQGMGQFTPYPHGYFQLHGMTENITLYKEGLVVNTPMSCQPKLKKDFLTKIEKAWDEAEVQKRTQAAIGHLAQYIPSFSSATVGSKPLFGAQQIPGDDPSLRVAEVSFALPHYARCEIVKVSSVLDMIKVICKDLEALGYVNQSTLEKRSFVRKEEDVTQRAKTIARLRHYPEEMASLTTPKR